VDLGMPPVEAERAVAERRVVLALLEHLISGGQRLTVTEVSARSGVAVPVLRRVDQALGLPRSAAYTEADLEHAEHLRELLGVIPLEPLLRTLRADAQSLTAIALRTIELTAHLFLDPLREETDDEVEAAVRLAALAGPLLDLAARGMGSAYRRVVTQLLSSELLARASFASDEVELAVGFVDVVGYTSLSARIDPSGLGEVLEAFESRCYATATHDAVRLVKFLGDAAMFVSVDPVALGRALHELVAEVQDEADPLYAAPMRGGLAMGRVLLRGGDYFGEPVNEAARLTDRARPSTVLASERMREVLADAFDLKKLTPVRLHGLGRQSPLALRRLRAPTAG
jgi:adenylate cyclase